KLLPILLGDMLTQKLSLKGISLVDKDYLAPIWQNRPELPNENAFLLEQEHVGETVSSKLAAVRAELLELGADHHLVSSLDDIAWLFNIRGKDVSYNPVVLTFAMITQDHAK